MSATAAVLRRRGTDSTATKADLRVLLVEDDAADRDLILREMGKAEFQILSDVVQTAEEFRRRVKSNPPDVILSDYNLGANSYIQKPVDFNQFRQTVKSVGLYWMVINQRPTTHVAEKSAAQGAS